MIEGDDIYGDGVNVAARLEALADPDGICVRREVRDQVRDKLPYVFEDMGEIAVKNIPRPIHVFKVLTDGVPTDAGKAAPDDAPKPGPALPDKPSIAVLPFVNMSGDAEQEFFADGITEDIITALSKFRWFFVIARNSTFVYKGQAVDVKQVGRELGVRYVLEGSVRKVANRVRISAQLIEAATGNHVWAEKYGRNITDIFAVQDEITANVSGAVGSEILRAEIGRAAKMSPTELGAWELSLRAWWHVNRVTKEDNVKAQEYCRQEIALMGNEATSYSALAFTHLYESLYGWSQRSTREAGAEAAERAAGTEHPVPDAADVDDGPVLAEAVDQALELGDHCTAASARAATAWGLER